MGRTPSRTNKKTSESRGENSKKPQSLTEGINKQVNAAEEKVQEIEEKNKSKQEKSSSDKSEDDLDFSEKDKAETLKFILERFPTRPVKGPIPKMHLGYGSSKGHQAELAEKRKLREAWGNTVAEESKNSAKPEKQQEEVKDENESTKEATTTVDPEDVLKQLEAAKKKIDELSKANKSLRNTNNVLNESIKQRAEEDAKKSQKTANEEPKAEEVKTDNSEEDLSSSRDVDAELREIIKAIKEDRVSDAQKLADQAAKKYGGTSEPKTDNSGNAEEIKSANSENFEEAETATSEPKSANSEYFEETVAPETGEPKANTEQATQEPKSEAKQTSTESSEMTPEEVYDYLSDKNNFKDAEQYFASGKDAYVGTNNKRIPKSWFDTFKENKDKNHKKLWFNKNNKDVFTASLRDKGLLEDLNKTPDRAETERVKAETAAKAEFDKSIKTMGNKLLGFMGKHPKITTALILTAGVPGAIKFINEFRNSSREQDIEDAQVSDSAFFGESDDNEDYNGEPIEPGEVAEKVANAAQETGQAGNNAEEQAAQTLQENLPQGKADATNQSKGESPAASNASTPASTKASTAELAPTQGLPPVVVNNTPPTNPNSSGMTYSQRVEAGQAPQAGSMAYNANNPDMVTANLIDAMNQNPQAGSDAIGYGDLYDQNFIDYWAKRNPNLAFGVSQGRR